MTVSTFYPDGNPETTSVDGVIRRTPASPYETFTEIRDGAGTTTDDSGPEAYVVFSSEATSPKYGTMGRVPVLFDTGPTIPDGDTIDSATFEFVCPLKQDQFSPAGSIRLVQSSPASNTGLVDADYNIANWPAATGQAPDMTIASVTADSATYNIMTLNSTGLGNISKTGVTKFGLRTVAEINGSTPTWVASSYQQVKVATAEEALAGDKRPKLVVTHTTGFIPKQLVF